MHGPVKKRRKSRHVPGPLWVALALMVMAVVACAVGIGLAYGSESGARDLCRTMTSVLGTAAPPRRRMLPIDRRDRQ
jgi:hypothetical protein